MMTTAFLALLLTFFAPAPAPEDVTLRWRGETYEMDALPPGIPPAARSAIENWVGWAEVNGYRMDLSEDGRVLLVTYARSKARGRQMKLVEKTIRLFDQVLPPPASRLEAVSEASPGMQDKPPEEPAEPTEDPLLDDPEGEPHPWEAGSVDEEDLIGEAPWNKSWGAGAHEPDTQTLVFLVLKKPVHYESMIARIVELAPHLAEWSKSAMKVTGFTVEHPLVGCYVEIGDGREEWDPNAELVNRIANLLLLRRFGQQPYWLKQGFAWYAEIELIGGVYCFPYRDEFVWATEHSGWRGALRGLFARRKDRPLRLDEVANWRRGTWDGDAAKIAWGVVDFLVAKHGRRLPECLEALRQFRIEHERIEDSENEWHRDPNYLIPIADQDRILREFIDQEYTFQATRHFRGEK